ncbi:hypothetical protein BDW62DRAFT_210562 [Aspergillus aurantiobrunneus]
MAPPTPSLETVVTIVDKANGEDDSNVADILSQFADLPSSKQDRVRSLFVTKMFPLVIGDNALVQGAGDYELQRQVPWSTNCWLQPQVIVTSTTSEQVAAALALCVFFPIKFSIRGGGHLHNPGFNSNNGGVVISLGGFRQVQLSDDKSTADIGLGLRWLDVYQALESHGLAVAGGRMPTVGVPGLILSGGISFQNSQYGLGAMGVSNYETSASSTPTPKKNTDLFSALKSGGANFGIITKIEMATIPNQIWSEARIYPPTAYDQLVDALMQYHEAIETNDQATLIWHATSEAILIVYIYCSPVEHPANMVHPGIRTIFELAQAMADVVSPEPVLHEFRTMSSRPSPNVYKAIEQALQEQLAALSDVEGVVLTNVFQPMSSLAMKQSANSPLGLNPVGQQWFLAMGDWKNADDESRVRSAVKKIVDVAESTARAEGTFLEYKYVNYASRDQDALENYGVENVERLRDIAGKYDPFGFFQELQGGGRWLLSKVGKGC